MTPQGVPERYGRDRRDLDVSAIDALRGYFGAHGEVTAEVRGTVVAI